MMSRFDDINIGDSAELTHIIRNEDVDRFVELTGDDNKLHTDSKFASTTPFKKPVVHGMLGASFISTIIGTKLPGDGALWYSQDLEFLSPVRVGDEITVKAEVIQKNTRQQSIELKTEIYNQNGVIVTSGIARVKVVDVVEPAQDESEGKDAEKDRVALVVGGTGGIGSKTAIQLAADGFDIALHYYRNKKKAENICKKIVEAGCSCRIFQADVSDETQVQCLIESVARYFNTVTTLVNCSTMHISSEPFSKLGWDRVQKHIDIAVKSTFYLSKAVLPVMKENDHGSIINLTTQYTESLPPPNLLAYVTAKSALNGLSKSLALEFAPFGITVNLVSPSMTDTDLIADVPEKTRLMTAAKTPLKRLALPEDVANAICYLASSRASFVTGETIRVNGGQVML